MKQHIGSYPERFAGRWVLHWHDEKTKRQYRVIGRLFVPTISNFDPEIRDRDELPERFRKRLAGDPAALGRVFSVLLRGTGYVAAAVPMGQ